MQYFNVDIQIPMGGDLAWKAILAEDPATWFRFCFMVSVAKIAADFNPDKFHGQIVDIWGNPYTIDELARLSPERGRRVIAKWHNSAKLLQFWHQLGTCNMFQCYTVTDWLRYWKQSKTSSSERVRAFRARQRSVACNALQTGEPSTCNALEGEGEGERELEKIPPNPQEGNGGAFGSRSENKNESNSYSSEPPGAKRIHEILGIKPSKRELARAKQLLSTRAPTGWSDQGWMRAKISELERQLHEVAQQIDAGQSYASPVAIAVARAETRLQRAARLPEERTA